jgi:SAM-dependent methyltransferase
VRGNSRFIAVDKSAAMTRTWWQPRSGSRDEALLADWRSVPIESASIDIVLADGSLCLVPFPDGCREILVEMQRLLRPGGRWIMRCFARPEQRETCARVFQELDDGLIGSFHILKWRLAMALQNDSESGIAIGRIFEEVANRFEQLDDLAACCGWPLEEVRTLEAYRGVSTRYFFPTLSEHVGVLEEEGFVVERMVTPDYELGDRCPTLVLSALR